MMNAQLQNAARAACAEVGIIYRDVPADGRFHETDIEDDPSGKGDGRIKYFPDGTGGIAFNWKGDKRHFFADDGRTLTDAELRERDRKRQEAIKQAEADEAARHAGAAKKALPIVEKGTPATAAHGYLQAKGIGPNGALLHSDGRLIIPMRIGKVLHSLQFISADGTKRFLPDGRVKGCYYLIGTGAEAKERGTMLICEGFATGATLREATDLPVVVCFTAGNLLEVSTFIRAQLPDVRQVICGDVDKSGTGQRAATEAAKAVAGIVALPAFTPAELAAEKPPSDWNDFSRLRGLDAVKAAITEFLKVGAGDTATDPPAADPDGWPEPSSLPKLPPVPGFPIDLLPDVLQALVSDCAARARYRPDFAAVAAMVALGSVIGRKLGIRLKKFDDWTEYANVWGGIIGPPSALKSPANRDGVKPFKALQVAADAVYRDAADQYAVEMEAYNLRKEAKKKKAVENLKQDATAKIDLGSDAAPEAPIQRTYWTSDATAAKLGELLAANSTGLLVERDELNSLLQSLEDEANADARGLYLSGWSGKEGYRFDRISRGTVTLPKYALSVFGGIQPGPLARYVRGAFSGERADGLLQRFQLLVWPEPESFEYVDRWPDSKAREAAAALFERADTFDSDAIGSHDKYGNEPPFVRLSDDAQIVFVDWYTRFMQFARSADSAGGVSAPLAAHFGKYPGLVGKLALILHVADEPTAKEVSARTLYKALAWIDYLTPHAERVYHAAEHPEAGAAELLLSRLKRDELPEKFKAWEITRKGWHGLSDREAVKKACRLLFEYGWLIELDPGGGQGIGRPADPTYAVSPRVGLSA